MTKTAYIECYPNGKARIKVYDDKGELDYNAPVDEIRVEVNRSEVRGIDDGTRAPLIVIGAHKN